MNALKKRVVVQAGGRIEIRVPELKAGTTAEVIVLEEAEASEGPNGHVPLRDLIGACRGMFATPEEADAFLSAEREAWDR